MIDVEHLLSKVDLVALAEQAGAKFRKTGKMLRSVCPLHGGDNRTAFSVWTNEDGRQLWHCWTGCNTGGDAFDFVRRWQGIGDFPDIARWLADWAHVPFEELGLTPEVVRVRQKDNQRKDLLELAAQFYRDRYQATPKAQEYVHGRGFTEEAITQAGFGFSDGRGLLAWLKQHHADLDLARKLGLLRKDGLDFTANAEGQAASPLGWLIYVHRERGRVLYLSARALAPRDPNDKSRNLPGEKQLYRAEVPGERALVLVEGQADAETLRQLGLSAWALCGTTLSEHDAEALVRRKPVYLALDNDRSGTARVEEVATKIGPLAMIAPALPDGHKDANDWLRAEPKPEAAQVAAWLKSAQPWIDRAIKGAKGCAAYEMEEHVSRVAHLVAALPEKMQGHYLRLASKALDVPARDLRLRGGNGLNGHTPRELADVRDGRLYYGDELLAHFTFLIRREQIIDDCHNLPRVRYAVEGRLPDGESLDPLDVKAEEFDCMKWAASWGARAIIEVPPSKSWMLARAVKGLSLAELKRERVYTASGWALIEQKRVFLTASGALSAEGLDTQVRVDLGDSNVRHYCLPEPPQDPRAAARASLEFLKLAPLRVTAPIWAAMYAAPLTFLQSLDAVLWLYGSSQSRKSTLAHLALAHFGPLFVKGHQYRAPQNWLSSFTKLENALFITKDLPLVIDDYRPQASTTAAQNQKSLADAIVRCVGNRVGRGRAQGNPELSDRPDRPPRGLVLSTAELPFGDDRGTAGRVIHIPFEKNDVALTVDLDRAQQLAGEGGPGLYAQAMSGYLAWWLSDWQHLTQTAADGIRDASQYARSVLDPSQARDPDYFGLLVTGARMALGYMASVQALARKEADRLAEETIPQTLIELFRQQGNLVASKSPVVRFCQALENLLVQAKIYLAPRLGDEAITPPIGATLVGWYGCDEDGRRCVYLIPVPCVQQARKHWETAGENFDLAVEAVKREMWQAGVLARRDKDQFDCSVRVREIGTKRVLVVDVKKLIAFAGVSLWPREMSEGSEADGNPAE